MMDISNQRRDPAPALVIFTLTGRVILYMEKTIEEMKVGLSEIVL